MTHKILRKKPKVDSFTEEEALNSIAKLISYYGEYAASLVLNKDVIAVEILKQNGDIIRIEKC